MSRQAKRSFAEVPPVLNLRCRRRVLGRGLSLETMEQRLLLSATQVAGDDTMNPAEISFNQGVELNGKLYFSGTVEGETTGNELWEYDASANQGAGSARLLKDIYTGTGSSNPDYLTVMDGKLYFAAQSIEEGNELWQFDPDANGGLGEVTLAADINSSSSFPVDLVALDGILYFRASDSIQGYELWKYDPAADNGNGQASIAADMNPDAQSSQPTGMTVLGGKLYFYATTAASGGELWEYDPTANNNAGAASLVSDINGNSGAGSNPTNFAVLDEKLYFSANDGESGESLWQFDPALNDGAGQLTRLSNVVGYDGISFPKWMTSLDGQLYFQARSSDTGSELWRYDPTENQINLVADIRANSVGSSPSYLVVLGNKLYFQANDGEHGKELWRYDPNATEDALVLDDVYPGPAGSTPIQLTVVGSTLYFQAYNTSNHPVLFSLSTNTPPIPQNDAYTTDEDTPLNIEMNGVLSNDDDPDGNPLTATVLVGPEHGDLLLNLDGTFLFLPDLNYNGPDGFTYEVSDGNGATASAEVMLTINPGLDPAVIAGTLTGQTDEDTTAKVTGIATVDDPDSGESFFKAQSETQGIHGTFSIDVNGHWTYTLDNAMAQSLNVNESVEESFPIESFDGLDTRLVTITITGLSDGPSATIESISSLRIAGNAIDVVGSAEDVDTGPASLTFKYEVFFEGGEVPVAMMSAAALTDFSFTPNMPGGYLIVLTVTDADNLTSQTEQEITVGSRSQLELRFANSVGSIGAMDDEEESSVARFDEWSDATAELWITIEADVRSTPFDLAWEFTSTRSWFADPRLLDALGSGNTWSTDGGTTMATLEGLDLSEYEVGTRVLLATILFPKNDEDPAGVPMNQTGMYPTPSTEHGVQLTKAEVVSTRQALATLPEVAGQFLPVIYDANDDGRVGLFDFSRFVGEFGKTVDENNSEAWGFDFNRDGYVGLADFSLFIQHFGYGKTGVHSSIEMPGLSPSSESEMAAVPLILEGEPDDTPVEEVASSTLVLGFSKKLPEAMPRDETTSVELETPPTLVETPYQSYGKLDPRWIDAAMANDEELRDFEESVGLEFQDDWNANENAV